MKWGTKLGVICNGSCMTDHHQGAVKQASAKHRTHSDNQCYIHLCGTDGPDAHCCMAEGFEVSINAVAQACCVTAAAQASKALTAAATWAVRLRLTMPPNFALLPYTIPREKV